MEIYTTKLSDVMTKDVITVKRLDLLSKVADIFSQHEFHHIPVVEEDGRIIGMVSKADFLLLCDSMTLLKKNFDHEINNRVFNSLTVEEVMTKQVARLRVDDPLMKAAGVFKENRFHAIPVVDEKNVLKGIVTTFDLLNFAYRDLSMKVKDYS